MIPDLSSIFSAYERLRDQADLIFAQVAKSQGPECVTCHKGCSDCCNALFDLSLVEAMYINHAFIKAFDYGPKRSEILTRADRADRQLTRMKRDLFHEEKKGIDTMTIMNDAATMRMRCPLLGDDGLCELYDARPITCRQKRLRDLENGQCLMQDLYGRVGVVQIHPVFVELLHAFDTRPPIKSEVDLE